MTTRREFVGCMLAPIALAATSETIKIDSIAEYPITNSSPPTLFVENASVIRGTRYQPRPDGYIQTLKRVEATPNFVVAATANMRPEGVHWEASLHMNPGERATIIAVSVSDPLPYR